MSEKKELTNEEVLKMAKDYFSELEQKDDIIKRYELSETPDEPMKDNFHAALVGRASHLVKKMLETGGMYEELDRAMEYFVVCIDSQKYNLDVRKCYDDLNINELLNKYDDKFKTIGTP